jgi:hypothetical protein
VVGGMIDEVVFAAEDVVLALSSVDDVMAALDA